MSKEGSSVLFSEVQAFGFPWPGILLAVAGFVSVGLTGTLMIHGMWTQLVLGKPWGQKPLPDGMLLLLGPTTVLISFLPLALLFARIKVEVRLGAVVVDPGFLARKRVIPRADILGCAVKPITALGFGILRGRAHGIPSRRKNVTYRLEGFEGVELRLPDGKTVVIASSRARTLAAAIETTRGPEPSLPSLPTTAARRL